MILANQMANKIKLNMFDHVIKLFKNELANKD